jgi:FG-GAP-like repeat
MKRAVVILTVISALAAAAAMTFFPGRQTEAGNAGVTQSQKPIFAPAAGSPIAVGGGPGNIALGDVNKDGKPDLVVASGRSRSITVLLGQGDGQFRAARMSPIQVPDSPSEMALGDFNGDSNLDLAIASHDSYGVALLLGDGAGSFALAPNSPIVMKEGRRPHTHGLETGDLNGDGHLDLVTANNADNDIAVVFGDGRGSFSRTAGSPFAVGKAPYPLAIGAVNSDGHLDIVVTSTLHGNSQSSYVLTVLLGDGRGGFQRSQAPVRTADPWYVAIGDLNGDRKPDLVTTHWERNQLTLLVGDGRGAFSETAGSPFDLGHSAWRVVVADVNHDRNADVVAAAGDGVRVMLGNGQGSLKPAPVSLFPTGKGAWRLAFGDMNGDGKPDVATSNLESDTVTVLLAQ